jgi:hypothetical protein
MDFDLKNAIDESFGGGPSHRPMEDRLRAGRRAVRRRRAVVSGVVALTMVGIVGAASAVTGGSGSAHRELHPATNDADTITACDRATPRSAAKDAFLASGAPRVLVRAAVDERATAVLLSADGTFWGDCRIDYTGRREGGAGITVYEMDPPPGPAGGFMGGFGYEGGWGCRADNELVPADCDTISFSVVERRSEDVARVEVELINGAKLSTAAERGFYAFEYRGATDLRPVNKNGSTKPIDDLVQRLQFYDADGTLIAEETAVGVTPTRGVPRISGLPSLTGTPYGFEEPVEEPATDGPVDAPVDDGPIAAPEPGLTGRARLQDRCTLEGLPTDGPELVDPRVVSWHETAHTAVAVLVGADDKAWASCVLPTDAVPYAHPSVGGFQMKPATFEPDDYHVDWAPTANEKPAGTRGFVWQLTDKLDPEVARVEATLADGQEIGNDTTDGYIALGGSGRLPADAAWDKDYFTPVPLVSSLRFYDADGNLLGESTDGTAVDGYPSQRWVP